MNTESTDKTHSFAAQLKRHSVALISLSVAIIGLSYSTWRNELTEENRNIRYAAFELLLKLGDLQELVFYRHYDKDKKKGNARTGWHYVLMIQDFSSLVPKPMKQKSMLLKKVWTDNWQSLGKSDKSEKIISQAIDQARVTVIKILTQLE